MSEIVMPDDLVAVNVVDGIEYKHPDLGTLLKHEYALSAFPQIERPISYACNATYHARHNSGLRPKGVIKWIVMHSTEGGTARSVAKWFTEEEAGGSTQLVVDDNECYRCLSDRQIPWGAIGANYHGFHIEQCGYARWSTTLWSKTHRKTLMRAAYKCALHCRYYNIPVTFVDHEGLVEGMNGITTHAECTKAFGGNHTDPGEGWPRHLFMMMVGGYYAALSVRKATTRRE